MVEVHKRDDLSDEARLAKRLRPRSRSVLSDVGDNMRVPMAGPPHFGTRKGK